MKALCVALLMLPFAFTVGCRSMGGAGRSPVVRGWMWYVPLPTVPVAPPPGLIYEKVKAPLSHNYDQTPANAGKTGMAKSFYIGLPFYPLLSFAADDCSIDQAAKNGGIAKVAYADYEFFNVLGVYSTFTVIAHGN